MTYKQSVIGLVGEQFAQKLQIDNAQIKQAVSYGIGVYAQVEPMNSRAYCQQCVPLLINNIEMDQQRMLSYHGATDNAIAALVKIMKHCQIKTPEMVRAIFKGLPLYADEEELVTVYGYIFTNMQQEFMASPMEKQVVIMVEPILRGLTKQLAPSFKAQYAQVFHVCMQNAGFKQGLELMMGGVSANSQREVEEFFK